MTYSSRELKLKSSNYVGKLVKSQRFFFPFCCLQGRVPRNEFGNLYVYKSSMIPDGCVHLQLNGLVAIARQLGIDCVPAVVGWNHCRGGTHPM